MASIHYTGDSTTAPTIPFIERLAAREQEKWADYMRYLLSQTKQSNGSALISADYVANLERLINTPYSELSERDKCLDRQEAHKTLRILTTEVA